LIWRAAGRSPELAVAAIDGAGGGLAAAWPGQEGGDLFIGTRVPASDPRDQQRRLGARAGLSRSARQGNTGPSGGPSGARRPAGARREEGQTPRCSRGTGQPGKGVRTSERRGRSLDAEVAGARRVRHGCAGDAARRRALAPKKFHCAPVCL
jgi:hypothetical protein